MKQYDDFLKKIGIVLPEPRVMEGFGMELPTIYLDRCMEVIVPATEEFIRKQLEAQQNVIIEDFMNYVRQYKGAKVAEKPTNSSTLTVEEIVSDVTTGVNESLKKIFPFGKNMITNPAFDKAFSKIEEEVTTDDSEEESDGSHRTHLKRADQYNAVYEFFLKNPNASREECIQALGISMNTLGRRLRDLYFDKGFSPMNAGYTPRGMDDEKMQKDLQILRDYIKTHPKAYKLDFMRNLKLRRDELDVYLRILSKEGVYTERSVKRDVSMPIDAKETKEISANKPEEIVVKPIAIEPKTTSVITEKTTVVKPAEEKKLEPKVEKPIKEAKTKKVLNHNRKEIFKYEDPTTKQSSYKEGGYMAGIRRRFEASNRSALKHSISDSVSNAFTLKEYFNSLPADVKNRAIMEHWDSAVADYNEVSKLETKVSALGLHLSKSKLTKMESFMLMNELNKKNVSVNDLLVRYGSYVTK